jgi:spore coat protein U-like protein
MKFHTYLGTAALAGLAAAGSHFFAPAAAAASQTANLGVSATVSTNCTISTTALGFGSYDPVGANASADLDGTGGLTVACTKGATATLGLGLGANASGSTRRMSDGSGSFLTYELYQDSGRSTVWGTAGAGLLTLTAAPSKAARVFTVYGRVPSNQDATAGSYTDTVVATVNF